MQVGRNDPCPCGSGKKYKNCCLAAERAVPFEVARANALKATDQRLMQRMLGFAMRRFGDAWLESAVSTYCDETLYEGEEQLLVPWAVYHLHDAGVGSTLAGYFREANARGLTSDERELMDAHAESWLSVWEIREVVDGVGMSLADMLTGEERFIHDVMGSKSATPRSGVMLIVTTVNGISFASGMHPILLPPRDMEFVVREARKICRVRTRPVRIEKLRDVPTQVDLIDLWRETAEYVLNRPRPQLVNTDGDEMIATTDHFDILTSDHSGLIDRLASLPGAKKAETSGQETMIVVTRPGNAKVESWDNTVIGTIMVGPKRLRVETNSARRADVLRDLLTAELGDLIRYRLRSDTSQDEMWRRATEDNAGNGSEMSDPETTAMMRELREAYMTRWLDEEIPALGGLTPRVAAKLPKARKTLDLLLREFESHEARLSEDERIDIDRLRDELGMGQ